MSRNLLSFTTLGLGGVLGSGAVLSDDQTEQVIQLISALLTILVGELIRRYLPSRTSRPADPDEPGVPDAPPAKTPAQSKEATSPDE